MLYIGQDTHSAIPLNLSQKPNGGKIIGSLAQGRPLRVLLVDNKGNHLIRASSGLTGWAQSGKGDDSETFPALTTAKDDTATIHYHPELGTPQDIHYYPQGEAVIGKPDADKPGIPPYHRLLQTALTPGGVRFNVDCTAGTAYADEEALPYCQLHETSDALPPKRPDGIATGTETTLPGNGCLYFHNNDSNDDYAYNFRTLEKQCPTADNSALEEVAQPMYALGGEATYAGMRAAGDEVEETIHNKPLPLYDRIDGEKAIAEIAAQSRIKPLLASEQSCANSDRDEECGTYWLLVQSADGTTG